MKITTPAGIIECTVDEYEDLVVRGLVPGKEQIIDQSADDDWLHKLPRIDKHGDVPDWMKNTVALYGCEIAQPITANECPSIDPQYTITTFNDNIDTKGTRLT